MGSCCLVLIGKLLRGLQPRGLFKIPSSGTSQRFKNDNCRYGPLAYGCDLGGGVANLHRIVLLALALLSSWLPASSYAYPAVSTGGSTEYSTRTYSNSALTATGFVASWAAACELSRASVTTLPASHQPIGVQVAATNCVVYSSLYGWSKLYDAGQNSRVSAVVLSCPSGGSLSGSTCTCTAPAVDTGSACTAPPSPCSWAAGQTQMIFGEFQIERGKELCSSGCGFALKADVGPADSSSRASASAPWFDTRTMGDFAGTGSVCTPSSTGATTGTPTPSPYPPGEDGAPPEGTCKPGTVPGTVNGYSICVKPGASGTTVTNTGGKSEESTDGVPKPNVGTEKSTSCTGSKCTTTTTTTTTQPTVGGVPGTSSVSVHTESEPKDDFCEKNPRSAMCIESSFTGGACGAPDACEGDAIQCAIAAQAKKTACALSPDADESDADYIAAKLLTGSQTGNLAGNQTVTIGAGSFDSTDAIGGGSGCIADKVVTIAGQAVTLPFSAVCGSLALLGNVLMLVSFLLAGRIVVRG